MSTDNKNTTIALIVFCIVVAVAALGYALWDRTPEDPENNVPINTDQTSSPKTPNGGASTGSTTTPYSTPDIFAPEVSTSSPSNTENSGLRVSNPVANSVVKSPLTITGEASAWYFEAEFPVQIEDTNGNLIAQSFVTAQKDWMTTDYVPFKGTLTFTVPPGVTEGKVVFKKANPSGLPQYDKSVAVPVKFN